MERKGVHHAAAHVGQGLDQSIAQQHGATTEVETNSIERLTAGLKTLYKLYRCTLITDAIAAVLKPLVALR